MNRLFAAVAISALALSGAAFAADAPSLAQSGQAPATTTSPAKPKPAIVKKADSKPTTGVVSGAPVTK